MCLEICAPVDCIERLHEHTSSCAPAEVNFSLFFLILATEYALYSASAKPISNRDKLSRSNETGKCLFSIIRCWWCCRCCCCCFAIVLTIQLARSSLSVALFYFHVWHMRYTMFVCLSVCRLVYQPVLRFSQVHIYTVTNIAESCNVMLRWRFIIDQYGIRWYETDFDCKVSTQIMLLLLLLLYPIELAQQIAQQELSNVFLFINKTHNKISSCYIDHIANINAKSNSSFNIIGIFHYYYPYWFYRWTQWSRKDYKNGSNKLNSAHVNRTPNLFKIQAVPSLCDCTSPNEKK